MHHKSESTVLFVQLLGDLISIEKQLSKYYLKLEKIAFTPELSKALSPEQTELQQHLLRLKLVKQLIGNPKISAKNAPHLPLVIFKAKESGQSKDLHMVAKVLELQNIKLSYYETMHPIAVAHEMEQAAGLIEQTINDNRNTNTWLRQILQNIIVPAVK